MIYAILILTLWLLVSICWLLILTRRKNYWKAAAAMFERSMGAAHAHKAKQRGALPSCPDPFLELADLRNQLARSNGDLLQTREIARQSAVVCGQLERSNASLRGTVTRMKAKKDAHIEIDPKLAEHLAKGHHKKHHGRA